MTVIFPNIRLARGGIVIFLSLICSFVLAEDRPVKNPDLVWQKWSPSAFTRARRENKLVLLDLTATWCQYCKKMDEVTYRDQRVTGMIKSHYIPVRADEAEYPSLARRYAKLGRPTTVIYSGDGTEIIRRRGYLKPQWMAWLLEAVADNPDPSEHR